MDFLGVRFEVKGAGVKLPPPGPLCLKLVNVPFSAKTLNFANISIFCKNLTSFGKGSTFIQNKCESCVREFSFCI